MGTTAFLLIFVAAAIFIAIRLGDQVILVAEDEWLVDPLCFELWVGLSHFHELSRRNIEQFFGKLTHHFHHRLVDECLHLSSIDLV